jgi:hypothetical protein
MGRDNLGSLRSNRKQAELRAPPNFAPRHLPHLQKSAVFDTICSFANSIQCFNLADSVVQNHSATTLGGIDSLTSLRRHQEK